MEAEKEAIERIGGELREIYCKTFGKEPDPEILRAEAEEFVAKYGPTATIKDIWA
jgi:hypothetical protein